jgi:hypothetical protein
LLTYVAIISGSPASAYGVYASSSYLRTWKIGYTSSAIEANLALISAAAPGMKAVFARYIPRFLNSMRQISPRTAKDSRSEEELFELHETDDYLLERNLASSAGDGREQQLGLPEKEEERSVTDPSVV